MIFCYSLLFCLSLHVPKLLVLGIVIDFLGFPISRLLIPFIRSSMSYVFELLGLS